MNLIFLTIAIYITNSNWLYFIFIFVSFFSITLFFVTVINTYAMATTKSSNENFNMDDFDSLLAVLSAEELENINELVDPEVFILHHIFSF